MLTEPVSMRPDVTTFPLHCVDSFSIEVSHPMRAGAGAGGVPEKGRQPDARHVDGAPRAFTQRPLCMSCNDTMLLQHGMTVSPLLLQLKLMVGGFDKSYDHQD